MAARFIYPGGKNSYIDRKGRVIGVDGE